MTVLTKELLINTINDQLGPFVTYEQMSCIDLESSTLEDILNNEMPSLLAYFVRKYPGCVSILNKDKIQTYDISLLLEHQPQLLGYFGFDSLEHNDFYHWAHLLARYPNLVYLVKNPNKIMDNEFWEIFDENYPAYHANDVAKNKYVSKYR